MDERDYMDLIEIYEYHLKDHLERARGQNTLPDEEAERGKCLLSAITKAQTAVAMKRSGYSGHGYPYDDGFSSARGDMAPREMRDHSMSGEMPWDDRRTSRNSGEGKMIEWLRRVAREDRNGQRRELAQQMLDEFATR